MQKFPDSSVPLNENKSYVYRNKILALTGMCIQDHVSHYNVFLRAATSLHYKRLPGKSINRWPLTL